MQTISIDIDRKYIYEYVTTLTGTLGRQKNDYDRFVCLPENYPALDRFMDTAIAVIEASIWRKLSSSYNTTLKYNNGKLTVSINNESFPDKLRGVLSTNTRLAFAYILTAMWLQGIDPDYYTQYANMADGYINKISVLSGQRTTKGAVYEDANADSEQTSQVTSTGVASLSDSENVNELAGCKFGEQPIRDTHSSKPSDFDDAVYYPDGTVMSF